jgi:hypothetical protein
MIGCLGQPRAAQDSDVVARPVAVVALAALAVIASGWGAWQSRIHTKHRSRRTGALLVLPTRAESPADQDRPLRPVH